MDSSSLELTKKRCVPCEGGIPSLKRPEIEQFLRAVPEWSLIRDDTMIRRQWRFPNFQTALEFLNRIGRVAEEEGHHPDLHLTGYRHVAVEITTHAVGGLTENDFILAAKIDRVPPGPSP